MARSDIYALERAQLALSRFFRPANPIALRELALQQAAHVVDRSLEAWLKKEQVKPLQAVPERIAVAVNSSPSAMYLIARAARMAAAIAGEFFVVYVDIGVVDERPGKQRTLKPEGDVARVCCFRIDSVRQERLARSLEGVDQ